MRKYWAVQARDAETYNRVVSFSSWQTPVQPTCVAYVVHTFDTGGLERCEAHLCNHLDRDRFEPMIQNPHQPYTVVSIVKPETPHQSRYTHAVSGEHRSVSLRNVEQTFRLERINRELCAVL